nr:mitochondrial Rho GTPase 1 [Ciona intestinalis]|eukprot:XP_002130293.1 mitochondrial Rho GTPase 1 [Ciona intestinalis]
MWKDIHILLLGEPKVGKTSLILSLVGEEFPEDVPDRVEEITIPGDVTPEKVPTHIVDFSEKEQGEYQLCEEIAKANVVCLVYDLADLTTLEKIKERWMPLIKDCSMHESMLPIILVGNKSDLISDSKMYEVIPIMNDFPEIETCIECSSKTLNNVSEMFFFAQKAVLYPTAPLYSPQDGDLKPESKIALVRIFKLFDKDNDGVLNDDELSYFQKICFSTPLAMQALQDVKNVVKKNCPDGIVDDSLTCDGFLYLHLLFVQRGRHETTWAVLRKFGYNGLLQINEDYLRPDLPPAPADTIPQLTMDARKFLNEVFSKYDKDEDGALNPMEMDDLFSVFPYEPWGSEVLNTVCTNSKGWITRAGFLSQWMLTTFIDAPRTLEYLGYLGYSALLDCASQAEAIHFTTNSTTHATDENNRDIFTCKVIGVRGVGKSAFLQGLLETSENTKKSKHSQVSVFAVNEVQVKNLSPVYLLLHEVDVSDLLAAGEGSFLCDVVCLLYDSTDADSFQCCVEVHKQFVVGSSVSCIVIATKADGKAVKQRCALQPVDFCLQNSLPPPIAFSSRQKSSTSVYETIAEMAAVPKSSTEHQTSALGIILKIGITTAILAGLGYGLYKYSNTFKKPNFLKS